MKKPYILLIALFVLNVANAQWVPQNSGTTNNLNSVCFTDANTGYIVGDSGVILKTIDGGINWLQQNSGVPYTLNSVFFISPESGYAVGDSGTILKTNNGGILWTLQPAGTDANFSSVHFPAVDTGYVGSYNVILKTTNGGLNWTILDVDTSELLLSINSLFFTNATTGYVVGWRYINFHSGAIIYNTENGGNDWTNMFQGPWFDFGSSLGSVFFTNTDTGYAVGSANGNCSLLKSNDGFLTWTTPTNFGWEWYITDVYFPSTNIGYAVTGYPGNIYKTIDCGETWISEYSGTGIDFRSIFFPNADTGYAVGDTGIILKTTNGGVGINDQHQTANSLTIFPNPANDKITIEAPAKGSLTILNLNGQQLITHQITEPKTNLDISKLPSGVYFVRLTGERTVEVGKIIKW